MQVFNGTVLGYGIAPVLTMIPGILGAAVTGVSDPIDGFMEVGGPTFGVIFLMVVFVANFCSMVTNPYFQSCVLKTTFPKIKWGYAVAINAIIVPIVIFPAIYDNFAPVLSVFATFGGRIVLRLGYRFAAEKIPCRPVWYIPSGVQDLLLSRRLERVCMDSDCCRNCSQLRN